MSDVYVVFDSAQVKSADPVTYDDNGNVVALSERFDTEQQDIRYQKRGRTVDDYTERQYNNYGWAIVNDVLTGKEQKKLFAQFSDEEDLDAKYKKSFDSYYMIPVGHYYSYNNKIVFIDGTNQSPEIDRIIEIDGESEYAIGVYLQEVIDNEGRLDSLDYLEYLADKKIFKQYTSEDFAPYGDLKGKRTGHNASSASYIDENRGRAKSTEEHTDTVKQMSRNGDLFFDIEDEDNIQSNFVREYESHYEDIGEILQNISDIEIPPAKVTSIVNRVLRENFGNIDKGTKC